MPDRYHLIISPKATQALTEICSYIEHESPANAALVATRLVVAIDSLEQLPHRYEVHEHRQDPRKTVRDGRSAVHHLLPDRRSPSIRANPIDLAWSKASTKPV